MSTPVHRLRPPGAAHRLHALVLDRHDQPFAWGFRDCCLWAADAVHAATGRDPAHDLRGAYFTARGALRIVQAAGSLPALADQRIGPRVAAAEAIDGDVCLLSPSVHDHTLGIGALGVLWRGGVLAQADRGLALHRVDVALQWWRATP